METSLPSVVPKGNPVGAFFESIGATLGITREYGAARYVGVAVCLVGFAALGWWFFRRRK